MPEDEEHPSLRRSEPGIGLTSPMTARRTPPDASPAVSLDTFHGLMEPNDQCEERSILGWRVRWPDSDSGGSQCASRGSRPGSRARPHEPGVARVQPIQRFGRRRQPRRSCLPGGLAFAHRNRVRTTEVAPRVRFGRMEAPLIRAGDVRIVFVVRGDHGESCAKVRRRAGATDRSSRCRSSLRADRTQSRDHRRTRRSRG
jgi:hypothetical protein